jgi:hypothetical protein
VNRARCDAGTEAPSRGAFANAGSLRLRREAGPLRPDRDLEDPDLVAHPLYDPFARGHVDWRCEPQGHVNPWANEGSAEDPDDAMPRPPGRGTRQHKPNRVQRMLRRRPDLPRIGPFDDDPDASNGLGPLPDRAAMPPLRGVSCPDPLVHFRGSPNPGRLAKNGLLAGHAVRNAAEGVNPFLMSRDRTRLAPSDSYTHNGWAGRRLPW